MSDQNRDQDTSEYETLGTMLQRIRVEQGIELEELAGETRISLSNLRAMEQDNFLSLPADAFARGFYAQYAGILNLEPDEVVGRFLMERGTMSRSDSIYMSPPPGKLSSEVSNLARPSGVSVMSTIGYILLLISVIIAGICWYLSINPATYLSEKLRGVEQTEQTQLSSHQQPSPPSLENEQKPGE